jgi:4-hydroxy-tetrahydrodipicolinate synthase
VSLYEAAKAGDLAMARELSSRVMDLSEAIYRVGKHGSAIIKGLKCSISILGVCDDFMAAPFHRFFEAEREIVRRRLAELGIQS